MNGNRWYVSIVIKTLLGYIETKRGPMPVRLSKYGKLD